MDPDMVGTGDILSACRAALQLENPTPGTSSRAAWERRIRLKPCGAASRRRPISKRQLDAGLRRSGRETKMPLTLHIADGTSGVSTRIAPFLIRLVKV